MKTLVKTVWIWLVFATSACGLIGSNEDLKPKEIIDEVVITAPILSKIGDDTTDRDTP
ncbi:hypothetical protein [Lunatibacter salilacus]|uniref:hypothetical protein n=1 Tax=Lunatibacter salilacus TaxID=2483804 RepID=UPI00131AF0A3|nr:hypothetical protein [Lunatibacter salilacus]